VRKLVFAALGFGLGCALAVYWLPVELLLGLGAGLLTAAVPLVLMSAGKPGKIAGLLLLGLSLALLWYRGYEKFRLEPIRALDGQTMTLTLEATEDSWDTDYGICCDGLAEIENVRCRVRFYLNEDRSLLAGDRVTGEFRLRYTAPGGSKNPTHHSGNGIMLIAYPKGTHSVIPGEADWRYPAARLRRHIVSALEAVIPEDGEPFARALLLGDTSDLDYATDSALSVSGLRHVAAVSGLHVSILFSMVFFLTRRNRWASALIGVPLLVLFAAMAGFSPSVLRSAIMQMLMLAALLLQKDYDPPTALGFAALLMLLVNPLTILSVGFQLSVASVSGILLFAQRMQDWLMDPKRLGRWKKGWARLAASFSAGVSVSLGALIFTLPLNAWYFGTVSLLSVLTNLLCVWVVTVVFCGIVAACVLGAIWLPLGQGLGWILGWLIRYILGVSGAVAAMPLSAVYTQSPYIVAWLVFCYGLLAVFLLSKGKRPLLLGCCAALGLCVALLASWTEPLLDDYRVTVLDVGQGQCVLLQSGGKTYMVDCGGSYDEEAADIAAGALLSQGITKLDGLILSHYDRDHVGGAEYLLQRIEADCLILPDGPGARLWDDRILEHHTGAVLRGRESLEIQWDQGKITVFASWDLNSSNESSLCVLFQTEKCDILITGDRGTRGEEMLLRAAAIPELDALVVGHHGAASSTGAELLAALRPGLALISVGRDNSYGHPDPEVLDRLEAFGCRIRRTDLEGTIIIRG